VIHLGTRCGSIDEFVERFAPFATETSLVMPTASEVKPGTEGRFVIHLKDRTPVMSGRCRVEEVKPVAPGPAGGGRMVMRVRLLEMDEASRNVHQQLLACKRPAPAPAVAPVAPKPPPLRIVRAPTLMGASAPIGTAATLIGTLPPPVPAAAPAAALSPPAPPAPPPAAEEHEKTMPSIKVPELQAPSASFTLPANPLSELEAADLASFIECTLFEADADPEAEPERAAGDDAKAPLAEADEPPARAAPVEARAEGSGGTDVTPMAAAPLLPPPAAPPLRRTLTHAAPYALCTVIGVLAGSLLRGSPAPSPPRDAKPVVELAPPATKIEAKAAAPAAPPAIAAAPAPANEAPPAVAAAPTIEPLAAAPRAGECSVTVTTEPADADVLWGAKELGRTPLRDVAIPCGASTLTLRHERYRDVKRSVTADSERALVVSERLRRPNAKLFLTSTPARALFTVNEQLLGPGPGHVSTWRYETVHVEAKLPGYAPWSRTFYLKDETMKVNAQLVSLKPPPRAPAKPGMKPPGAKPAVKPLAPPPTMRR
jgi:hypothetical protein